MRFGTKVIHAGINADEATGAVMTPIYQTSTYQQEAPGVNKGYEYARSSNPTRKVLESNLAALENGKHAFVFGSGMAATDTIFRMLEPGDEVVSTKDLYGGSYRLFSQVYEPMKVKFKYVSMAKMADIEAAISPKTKMLWLETPTNPTLQIIDIAAACRIAKKYKLLVAVDNTFASPYLQNPLDLGADLIMHSATKYLAGHSDVVMGALICNEERLAEKLGFTQKSVGAIPGPQDCFLALRGIKTLHLRMQRHCENGAAVANFLRAHPKVKLVNWPGFTDHPHHQIAKEQMKDFGGMCSFSLKGNDKADAFKLMSSFSLFTLAESLGGVESLVCHPASMTHASMSEAERLEAGIPDSLIRLSVGVEDVNDLLEDLEHALKKI